VLAKYSFKLASADDRRPLPGRLILGQNLTETLAQVVLKLFAFLLFHRERLQIEPALHDDNIPFVPDLVQLDYTLRPALWIECGECSVEKLDRLAVKVPEAEVWVLKRSVAAAEQLHQSMARQGLRRGRYKLLGMDAAMFDEVEGLVQSRNEIFWVAGRFDPPVLQFDLNGLWFDAPFTVLEF
jgi:uncharacterized protein YaeQ